MSYNIQGWDDSQVTPQACMHPEKVALEDDLLHKSHRFYSDDRDGP